MLSHKPAEHLGLGSGGTVGLARVLVATDFSPHSACALARALRLPLREGAEVLVVHALPDEPASGGGPGAAEALARHALEETVHHTWEERARVACDVRGLLVRGLLAESLPQVARGFGAELVVLGRPRRPGSLLTRVRERMDGGLVESIPTAFLVVGPPPVASYRRPLVAVDFTEASRLALEAVLRLCPDAGRVVVLHDYDTSYELVLHQAAARLSRVLEYQREAKERARAELHRFLAPYQQAGVRFDVCVRSGETPASILDFAQEEHADLVAVGRHLRSGLGRIVRPHVAQQVVRESACDVLVLETSPLPGTVS